MDIAEAHIPEVGERHQQRRLVGGLVASPFFGVDEFDVEGRFFPFSDLSCRTMGKYRLKLTLVIIDLFNNKPGKKLPVKVTVLSDVFEVYTARTFPGIVEGTDLARRLKARGCVINVKKGRQGLDRRQAAFSSEEDDQANSKDGDRNNEDMETGQRKRQRFLKT